jgi:hypothetical protein
MPEVEPADGAEWMELLPQFCLLDEEGGAYYILDVLLQA